MFLGAKRFGNHAQKLKRCVVLDKDRYRFQKYISDISGQDIHSHEGALKKLIEELASWLRVQSRDPKVPGGRKIAEEFETFRREIPKICQSRKIEPDELTFGDYTEMVVEYIAVSLR